MPNSKANSKAFSAWKQGTLQAKRPTMPTQASGRMNSTTRPSLGRTTATTAMARKPAQLDALRRTITPMPPVSKIAPTAPVAKPVAPLTKL